MLAEQGPTLALGHPPPDAKFRLMVKCIGEALGDHRASLAHQLRLPLRRTGDEKGVRMPSDAETKPSPFGSQARRRYLYQPDP